MSQNSIFLSSEEQTARDSYLAALAGKLPPLRLRWYKFLWYWKLGNLRRILAALQAHEEAIEVEREHRRIEKLLEPEAQLFTHYLQDALSRLGYSELEHQEGKRRFRNKVRFHLPILMREDAFYIRVMTTKRGAFASRSELPYKTRAVDLVAEDTLKHLSLVLDRRVTAEWRPGRGLWFIVWRSQDMAGLPRLVHFLDMLKFFKPGRPELCLGVGDARTVHIVDLSEVPHALVAGETGGGKSNLVNGFICGLIRHNTPQQVKLILIDLKEGTEFGDYEHVPHLALPIITDASRALVALKQALALVKLRYRRMSARRARTLDQYNETLTLDRRWPRLIIVVDELAEILTGRSKVKEEVELMLVRICQLGRAAGIHVIAATQRPQANIVSTAISGNMPLKVSGKMGRANDSMTILGTGDATQLDDVPGRSCYKKSWRIIQVQPPLMRPDDIDESIALALDMPAYTLDLPDMATTDAIVSSEFGTMDDHTEQLATMLERAGGRLNVANLSDILGMSRGEATRFQESVTGLSFERDGGRYTVVKQGNSYRIEPAAAASEPLPDDDLEPAEAAPQGAKSGPQKWPGRKANHNGG